VVDLDSRCWINAVAVVSDYVAIVSDDFTELRMRIAACAVSSGGGISIIDCETGRLIKVVDDRGASRPKMAVCFSNPPTDLRVGPLMVVGTTAQCERSRSHPINRGTREAVQGRLLLKDLLTGETLFDSAYPSTVNCVAIYEGMKGVEKRNKVFLSEEEQQDAKALLGNVPMLPSIVVAGSGSKVHVWAFERGPDAELAVLDRHDNGSVVLGVTICLAPTAYMGTLKSVILTCGSDGKVHVYDMRTFNHLQTMDHTCGCYCVAATCIADDPVVPETDTCDDDDDDDKPEAPRRRSSVSAVYASVDLLWAGPRTAQRMRAVSGGFDGCVRVWDADSGSLLHTLTGHAGTVNAVAVIPPATEGVQRVVGVVSAGVDGVVRVWDLCRGLLLGVILAHGDAVTTVAVSVAVAGRPFVVSGGKDGKVCVWDLEAAGSPVQGLLA
jgi:WD40 repeat protein